MRPSFLRIEVADRVAVVTLEDPRHRNAINDTMNIELVKAIDDFESNDDVQALVLTGAGSAFCAGADLNLLRDATDPDQLRSLYSGFLRVATCTLPTVAAVNGPAIGAGMNFALATDLVIAGESALFDSRFLRIGLHPGGGHAWRLGQLTNERVVRAMILFGEKLDGRRAVEVGLAWRCVADNELLDVARTVAVHAINTPRDLMARTKETLAHLGKANTLDEAVALELDPQAWSAAQPVFQTLITDLQRQISGKDDQ
jgi:enoyl-CoA hydratase